MLLFTPLFLLLYHAQKVLLLLRHLIQGTYSLHKPCSFSERHPLSTYIQYVLLFFWKDTLFTHTKISLSCLGSHDSLKTSLCLCLPVPFKTTIHPPKKSSVLDTPITFLHNQHKTHSLHLSHPQPTLLPSFPFPKRTTQATPAPSSSRSSACAARHPPPPPPPPLLPPQSPHEAHHQTKKAPCSWKRRVGG